MKVTPEHNERIAKMTFASVYPHYVVTVSYTHLRAHETVLDLVCRLLLEKKKHTYHHHIDSYADHTHKDYNTTMTK